MNIGKIHYFVDINLNVAKIIAKMLANDEAEGHGIVIDEITTDTLLACNWDADEEEFITTYRDECMLYMVHGERFDTIIAVQEDYRTYADTQIYKEGGKPSEEEWEIIHDYTESAYKYNDDEPNNYFAISFNDVNQRTRPLWGDILVSKLNAWVDEHTKDDEEPQYWYLGNEYEEYVFCY